MDWDHRKGGCNGCNAVTALSLKKKYFDLSDHGELKVESLSRNPRYGVTALQVRVKGLGKWPSMKKSKDGSHIRKDIPHAGWALVDHSDNRTPDHRCEACGYPKVRFVHKLAHPDVGSTILRAGHICAGQLTGQPYVVRLRETELRRTARLRVEFMKKGWSLYHQDNGLGLALRKEPDATFKVKEQADRTWKLYRCGRGIPTAVISERHPSMEAGMTALFMLLYGRSDSDRMLQANK